MRDVVAQAVREVEGGGYLEESEFTILANAKAFRLLIDGLYADKPRAIVRELWSNAFDAHRERGNADQPFESHLPTQFAPEFAVRDFGISLSHEQVMKLYTTVFMSTKENSNTGVGKFGLGSKTPFAYADQFTVTVWKDGQKRLYNAFINEEGKPRIALFHTEESDEEQGVEVRFGVNPKDIRDFVRAAEETVLGFDVAPKQTGAQVDVETYPVKYQGNGWSIRESRYGTNVAKVRQGCVIYPLDHGALYEAMKGRDSSGLKYLLDTNLIFDVPIGSVEITPSRESLSYDPVTSKNVVDRLEEILGELLNEHLVPIPSTLREREAYAEFKKRCDAIPEGLNARLHNWIRTRIQWRGRPADGIKFSWFAPRPKMLDMIYVERGYSDGISNCPRTFRTDKMCGGFRMDFSDEIHIVLQDPELKVTHAGLRVAKHFRSIERGDKHFLWIRGKEADLKRLYVALKRPPVWNVVKIETLDHGIQNLDSLGPREKGKMKLRRYDLANGEWKEERVSIAEGGFVFWMEDGHCSGRNHIATVEGANGASLVIERLKTMGVLDGSEKFFIAPKRAHPSLNRVNRASRDEGGDDLWECAMDFAYDHARAGWTDADAQLLAGDNAKRSLRNAINNDALKIMRLAVEREAAGLLTITAGKELANLREAADALNAFTDSNIPPEKDAARTLCGWFNIDRSSVVPAPVSALENKVVDAQAAFMKRYPLAARLFQRNYIDDALAGEILDYIILVDRS